MPDRPSRTSTLVAALRGLADAGLTQVRDFADPTARVLLPGPVGELTRLAAVPLTRAPVLGRALWWVTLGGFDLLPLRTRAIDDAWGEAHAAGARQLVLLGAGLDGRAHRLETLAGTRVFELDRPGTQALKRERAASLPLKAGSLTYVPVDFAVDDPGAALARAGYDTGAPAFLVLEGVTPYLPPEVTGDTLKAVARAMAKGSRIAVTYIPPRGRFEGGPLAAVGHLVDRLGEPFVGLLPEAEMAGLIRAAGLEVASDTGLRDWAARYARRRPLANGRFEERLVVGYA